MELGFQNSLKIEKDRYQINKLICVNSMKNICYIELDVTQNTVLYGDNNLGKTSILSTLKLHLLPEINFRDSKNKFSFVGSSGKPYNNQESRDYYFPSINSFLILEGENPFGPYVYILFRASEEQFGYSRLVLPVSYHEIEHEFWDKSSSVNQNLGGINPDLSLKNIKSLVKKYNGRLLRTVQEIRETLYTFNQLNEDKGRFCVIPMKEGGVKREIEAFRRLLQFTFEINQSSPASLTNALATIIEGQKKDQKDELDQNLRLIIDEYNDLNIKQDKITLLKNTLNYYQRIKQFHQQAQTSVQQSGELFWQLKTSLLINQKNLEAQEQIIKPEYNVLNDDTLPEEHKKHGQFKREEQEVKSHYDELNGLLKGEQKKVDRIKFLMEEEYSIVNQNDIEELLREDIEGLEKTIESLADRESFAVALEKKIIEKNNTKTLLQRVMGFLDNAESSLLHQVSSHAATILSSINPKFDQLTINKGSNTLDDSIEVIEKFSQLFAEKDEHLFFEEQKFIYPVEHFDPKEQQQKWQNQKFEHENNLQRLSREISDDSKQLSEFTAEKIEQKKLDTQRILEGNKRDLSLIIDCDKVNQDFMNHTQQLQEQDDQLKKINRDLEDLREQLKIYENKKHDLKQQLKVLGEQRANIDRMNHQIKNYTQYESQFAPYNMPNTGSINVSEELMAELEQKIRQFQDSLNHTEDDIYDLMVKEKLTILDNDVVYSRGKSLEELTLLVEQLSAEYENIDSYEKHLQVLVRKHNKIVGVKVSELEQNNQLINDFRHKLDNAFRGIRISDLKEIHIKLKLDPRFDELLADIQSENIDFYHDSLISADFYGKLNIFCEQFFTYKKGNNETLTLEGLIKEVLYEYRIQGQEKRTTSSQSNGTNAIINSTFLTILLKELIQPNIILALPVIFDEIANLDEKNMLSVVEVVKNNHFSLFSATPTENLQLNNALGNFIHLDLFKASEQSYDKSRPIIYYGGAERLEILPLDNLSSDELSEEVK